RLTNMLTGPPWSRATARNHTLAGTQLNIPSADPATDPCKELAMFSTKELVLKTVGHFERNPQCYRYTCNRIPQSSCELGCVLGWMAHFSGEYNHGVLTPDVIARITCDPVSACDVGYNDFFKRLDECYPLYRGRWRSDVTHAVAALRAYAARYPE